MNLKLVFLLVGALLPSTIWSQLAVVETLDEEHAARVVFLNPEYLVYRPDAAKTEARIPLVIFLHGAGGAGDDVRTNLARGRAVVEGIRRFEKGPCLVVAPQCLRESPKSEERGTWEAGDLDVFLKYVLQRHPDIDTDRIYLTGTSMGGYGSWMWGGHSPEHFAAIAPIVGGIGRGGPKDVTPDLEKWAENLAKVPVWAFAGGLDKVVPAERSERMIAAIRKAGGTEAKILVYPDEGHAAGRRVFDSREFFDWMFAQKR